MCAVARPVRRFTDATVARDRLQHQVVPRGVGEERRIVLEDEVEGGRVRLVVVQAAWIQGRRRSSWPPLAPRRASRRRPGGWTRWRTGSPHRGGPAWRRSPARKGRARY